MTTQHTATLLCMQHTCSTPVGLELRLVVVHAILAGQRLNQVFQRHVAAHIVRDADGALDLWGGVSMAAGVHGGGGRSWRRRAFMGVHGAAGGEEKRGEGSWTCG